jgi:hypothetical protein
MFTTVSMASRCGNRTAGLFFPTDAQTRTMLDTALHPSTRTDSRNCPAAEADEPRVPQRASPAAKNDFDTVSVAQALCATGYSALRDIQIEIERGIVVLWGRVPTYYQKQLAQATVQRVAGVRGVANGIEVACGRWGSFSTLRKHFDQRNIIMLWTIFVILLILWALGMVTSYTLGGFIHLLLIVAVVVVLIRVIQGRQPI